MLGKIWSPLLVQVMPCLHITLVIHNFFPQLVLFIKIIGLATFNQAGLGDYIIKSLKHENVVEEIKATVKVLFRYVGIPDKLPNLGDIMG